MFRCDRRIDPCLLQGLLELVLAGQAGLDLVPLLGDPEVFRSERLPSDGVFQKLSVGPSSTK